METIGVQKVLGILASVILSFIPADDYKEQKKNIDVFKKTSPSVVYIYTIRQDGKKYYGSGVVYDELGKIVTASHVVNGASSITCEFIDGTVIPAMTVLIDPARDLATVHLEALPEKIKAIKFRRKPIKIGKPLWALGNPYKQKFSLSKGIVSQVRDEVVNPGSYVIMGALQTDASLNPGNSGGAIVDDKGKLVGIASLLVGAATATGVAYAIPTAEIEKFIGGQ